MYLLIFSEKKASRVTLEKTALYPDLYYMFTEILKSSEDKK